MPNMVNASLPAYAEKKHCPTDLNVTTQDKRDYRQIMETIYNTASIKKQLRFMFMLSGP